MKTYRQGPIPNQNRYCTDFCCFMLFLIFSSALLVLGVYAWKQDNFKKIMYPYDSDHKACGIDLPKHPYIYFAAPAADTLWITTCVSKCPKTTRERLKCHSNSFVSKCRQYNTGEQIKKLKIYQTQPYQGRVCLPTSQALKNIVSNGLAFKGMERRINDIKNSWKVILSSTIVAIVLGLFFMLVIRLCAGLIIWSSIIIAIVSLFSFGFVLMQIKTILPFGQILNDSSTARQIGSGVLFVLAALLAVVSCCYCRKITLTGKIVSTATNFVTSQCLLSLLPIFLFMLLIAFIIYWFALAIGFYSLGTPINIPHSLPFQHFQTTNKVKVLLGVHLFYLLWGVCFLIETSKFIVAGAATNWYFQHIFPLAKSFLRFIMFHMGSVCIGSFLVALFGFLKIIYNLITPDDNVQSGCLYNIKKCCDCFFCFCLSTVFQWLNSNAYTWIHLTSNSFCQSAARSTGLQVSNAATSGFIVILSTIFSVIFRLGITIITSLLAYITLKYGSSYNHSISQPLIPTLLIALLSFSVASFYISLYKDASEAIYMCFIAQADAGGSIVCPPQLQDFLIDAVRQNNYV